MICLSDTRRKLEQERARLRARLSEIDAKLVTLSHITGLTRRELLRRAKEEA